MKESGRFSNRPDSVSFPEITNAQVFAAIMNLMGLIAHNLLRHVDARHSGKFNSDCETCKRHVEAFAIENDTVSPLDGDDIVRIQRRSESPQPEP